MGTLGWRKGTIKDRLLSKIEVVNGHWLWTGCTGDNGYGKIGVIGKDGIQRTRYAHILSYEVHVGPVPEEFELDHLCRIRRCINPECLEPVTHRENGLRGFSPAAQLARRTQCNYGHNLSGENLWIDNRGARVCLTCKRNREKITGKKYRLKKKELVASLDE